MKTSTIRLTGTDGKLREYCIIKERVYYNTVKNGAVWGGTKHFDDKKAPHLTDAQMTKISKIRSGL